MAIEACSGGTPDLGFFSGVSIFIEIDGAGFMLGGPRVNDKDGAPSLGGRARPPHFWMAQDSLLLRGLLFVHKKSTKFGRSFGLRLVFLFCKTQKARKKQKLALGSRLIG